MASRTVLVTGAAGSVGSALVPRLADRGWDVRAIDLVRNESAVGHRIIGDCFDESPNTVRHLATWLSPDDLGAVFDAALSAPGQGHSIVYGISRNKRRWWGLEPGRAIGYDPVDDAEDHLDTIDPQSGTPEELDYL